MNAVVVKGDAVGPTLYYGPGAGAEPTASAVIADIVDLARTLTADPEHRVPHLGFQPDQLSDIQVLSIEQVETAYYLRITARDVPGVLSKITQILSDAKISIEAVIQKEADDGEDYVPLIILTDRAVVKKLDEAVDKIQQLPTTEGDIVRIRVESLG
jgi:homoserine dehydrogenase